MGLMTTIEDMGGAVAAIERGFQKAEIERTAYDVAREIDAGERVVVGVNKFVSEGEEPYELLPVDPAIESEQVARIERLRSRRDTAEFTRRISDLKAIAEGTGTCCTRCARRCARRPPSARSVTRFATYGAFTGRRTPTRRGPHLGLPN